MNKTFLITSISNTWHNSIHLAEQLMTQAKYCGASAIHINVSNLQKPHFMFLKSYTDKFNLPVIPTINNKKSVLISWKNCIRKYIGAI